MGIPKMGKSKNGKDMHYSVGAIIERLGNFLLVDRLKPPFGFAAIAGHINEGETIEQALMREVKEESDLKVESCRLIFEDEISWNKCRKGVETHYWYVFKCETSGEIKRNPFETKSIGWYSKDEIKRVNLEPIWIFWFKKFKIIP
jgi:ADP-ribose pyrophosphatase YjhB (NUDIX family)